MGGLEIIVLILLIINCIKVKNEKPIYELTKNDFSSNVISYDNDGNGWLATPESLEEKYPTNVLTSDLIKLRRGTYKILVDYNIDYPAYINIDLTSDRTWYAINPNNFSIFLNQEVPVTEYKIEITNDEVNATFSLNYAGYGNALIKSIKVYNSIFEPIKNLLFYIVFIIFLDIFLYILYIKDAKNKNKHIKILIQCVLFIIYLSTIIFLIFFFYKKYNSIIDSDFSNQMVLSKFLNEKGQIITKDYYYETELPILSYQLIYSLLFNFISNWHIVRIVGNIIQIFLLQLALLYLCKQLKIEKYFFIIGTILVMPLSEQWMIMGLLSTYYTHIEIAAFFVVAAVINITNSENKIKKNILTIIVCLLSIIEGMEGFRSLYVIFAPLLLGSIMLYLMKKNENITVDEKTKSYFHISLLASICSIIGFIIYSKKLQLEYNFSNYQDAKWQNFSIDNFNGILENYLTNFGMNEGLIFSVVLIENICAVLVIIISIFAFVKILPEKNNFTEDERIYTAYVFSTFVSTIILFSFSNQHVADRYIMPVALFQIPLVFLYLDKKDENKDKNNIKTALLFFIVLGIIIGEINSYGKYYLKYQQSERENIANYLVQNGYKEGYARYWDADVLQEISDGKINTWSWEMSGDMTNVNDSLFKWGQSKEVFSKKPEGKIFWILGVDDVNNLSLTNNVSEKYIAYKTKYYAIYTFENYIEMENAIAGIQ